VAITLAGRMASLGFHIDFVLLRGEGPLLGEVPHNCRVHALDAPHIRNALGPLRSYLERERPIAVMAFMWPLTVIAAVAVRSVAARPRLVVADHCEMSRQYPKPTSRLAMLATMQLTYRLADVRVVVSEGVAEDLGRVSGLGRKAFTVIDNPVPPPEPVPVPDRIDRLWGVPHGARILTVGSLKQQKNHQLLFKAFAQIANPDARLMIVGSGPEEASLRSLAGDLGISNRVCFAGFQEPQPFYASADLFVLPSDYEGQPMVLIEALAHGLPIVSTDCRSGPREILCGGEYGTLVPVGDRDALTAAVLASLAEPNDSDRQKARAQHFAPERIAFEYLKALVSSD